MSSLTSKFYKTPKSQATPTGGGAKGTTEGKSQRGDVAKEESECKPRYEVKMSVILDVDIAGDVSAGSVRKPSKVESGGAGDDWDDEEWEVSGCGEGVATK